MDELGGVGDTYGFWVGKREGRDALKDVGVRGWMIQKLILNYE